MGDETRISGFQLTMLLMGFLFGSSAIISPAKDAGPDAWLAYLIGWGGGCLLLAMYARIASLHPGQNLVGILRSTLGPYLGGAVSVLYIWFFIHLTALITRYSTEYLVGTLYPETPLLFVGLCGAVVVTYCIRTGLEVLARLAELLTPILPLMVLFLCISVYSRLDFSHLFPFLQKGWSPVLQSALSLFTLPFGEAVAFLMVFPHLNRPEQLMRTVMWAAFLMGAILFLPLVRDLLVLGADLIERSAFPPQTTAKLMPDMNIDPLIAVNLMIGIGLKSGITLYAACRCLADLCALHNFRTLVIPTNALVIALSIWLYPNYFEMFTFAKDIWPYYALPFQLFIPLLILLISWHKTGKSTARKSSAA